MRLWLRGGTSRKKVNEIIKSRMQITRAFKGKGVTDAAGEVVMLRIVSKFLSVFELSSFSMSQVIGSTWRRRNKVAKVRMKGVVEEGYEYVGAKARQSAACRACPVNDCGRSALFRVIFVYPRR